MDDKAALIVFGKKYKNNKYTFNLSKSGDIKEAARNLYKTLRKIKNLGFKNSILIVILITAILVSFSYEKQNKYYSSFIVESVPIYWLIVEIGLQILL